MYGLLVTVLFIVILALPLIVVIAAPTISPETTVTLYATGLVVDLVVFLTLTGLTFVYAAKASRGELFAIPIVSALADRIFRLPR
jgi:uncharacterized membrane protein